MEGESKTLLEKSGLASQLAQGNVRLKSTEGSGQRKRKKQQRAASSEIAVEG